MIWFRNIFADTLSTNNGALTVENLGLTNRITFRPSTNAELYKLFARKIGESVWINIGSIDPTDLQNDSTFFVDDFRWITDESGAVSVEYKVVVTKTIPLTSDGYYTSGFEGDDDDGGVVRREFIPDHRPFFSISLSVSTSPDYDITVSGVIQKKTGNRIGPCSGVSEEVAIIGADELDHWKVQPGKNDGSALNPLFPPCPGKPWLTPGYAISRKSNPNTDDPNEDFMLYLVNTDAENPGSLEDAYRRGYRRMLIRGPFGMMTTALDTQGSAVPGSIWSAGDPDLGTWNDKRRIGWGPGGGDPADDPNAPLEYPFTSNGNLMSMDDTATKGNAQQSVIKFLKPWLQSKEDLGDPVDLYIYGAMQPAFYADGSPARGTLSQAWFQDADWTADRTNPASGKKWRFHYPLGDGSNPMHREFWDGEYLPWMDVGAKGFIIDGASNVNNESPAGDAQHPVARPPGFFDYFRDHLGVDVIGEAVPLSSFGNATTPAAINQDLYRDTGFMAYSNGTFWQERWRDIQISPPPGEPLDSEIHIFLVWTFAGAAGGFNSNYATGSGNNVVYDIDGMKAEIDQMRSNGFVVSCNISRYTSASPAAEGPARTAIMDYVADCRQSGQDK
jgi:hypothetical protein